MILFEGLFCCLVVLVSCVAGIANGPENMVFFYDKKVQERAVAEGLTDKDAIRRNLMRFRIFGIIPYFIFVFCAVYVINKARTFSEAFPQMTAILLIEGLFDRLFIDWYWVNHTKAWIIKGTEDLRPYIDKKAWAYKWTTMIIGCPLLAAVISGLMSLVLK